MLFRAIIADVFRYAAARAVTPRHVDLRFSIPASPARPHHPALEQKRTILSVPCLPESRSLLVHVRAIAARTAKMF